MALAILLSTLVQAQPDVAGVDSLPGVEELPDPFLFQDGSRVGNLEDWQARRAEIRDLVLRYEYGTAPPAPGNVRAGERITSELVHDGGTLHETLLLTMGPENRLTTTVHVYVPQGRSGPFPAVVRIGMGDECVAEMSRRGYIFACFEHRELDPDTEGYDVRGPAQMLYPEHTWGSLGVWAWGASRVLDFLLTRPDVNGEQVVVTGHSRTGKTALLAGALDERFALVVPNGSGCGGAACFRNAPEGVETLELITRPDRFKSWFRSDFGQFGDTESRLPFDQHFMRALVAPRPVLSTDALGDQWANPPGTQRAWMAAQPVFDFLGAGESNLCHFREGGHDQLPEDFEVLLDVADWVFRSKALTRDFSALPESGMKPTWPWEAPEPVR
jgi:(4-O-methyl)-D-glucuronate---lignin esterase